MPFKKFFILICFLFVSCLAITACTVSGVSNEKIRYRMTASVETPEGLKTGSAVREAARYSESSILPDQGGVMYNITKGEAVFVNLAERGDLFVLLGGEDEAKIVFSHFRQGTSQGPSLVELSQYQYPKLVHFKNISDPTSIEMVMEFQSCADKSQRMLAEKKCLKADLFETIYGRGVRLRSIIIERTDEAVTRSIASHMPSYRDQEQYLKWFRTLPYGDPRAVNANDFGAIGGSNAD